MPEIDLKPDEVREHYDVKPMSRWWLVGAAALVGLQAYGNGIDRPATWGLVLFGVAFGFALILCFPRHFLRRRDD